MTDTVADYLAEWRRTCVTMEIPYVEAEALKFAREARPDLFECEICELPLNQCAHSPAAKAVQDREKPIETGPTILARTSSPCGGCTGLIQPEDSITYTDVGWVHTRHVRPEPTDQFAGYDL